MWIHVIRGTCFYIFLSYYLNPTSYNCHYVVVKYMRTIINRLKCNNENARRTQRTTHIYIYINQPNMRNNVRGKCLHTGWTTQPQRDWNAWTATFRFVSSLYAKRQSRKWRNEFNYLISRAKLDFMYFWVKKLMWYTSGIWWDFENWGNVETFKATRTCLLKTDVVQVYSKFCSVEWIYSDAVSYAVRVEVNWFFGNKLFFPVFFFCLAHMRIYINVLFCTCFWVGILFTICPNMMFNCLDHKKYILDINLMGYIWKPEAFKRPRHTVSFFTFSSTFGSKQTSKSISWNVHWARIPIVH